MTYEAIQQKKYDLISELVKLGESEDTAKEQLKLKIEISELETKMLKVIHTEDEAKISLNAGNFIKLVQGMPNVPLHATGIHGLDESLGGGIETGTFVQLSGESGVGKTKLLLDIVCNVAKGFKSVFFNREMGKRRLAQRLMQKNLNETQLLNLEIDSETTFLHDIVDQVELHIREGYKFFMYDSKMKIEVKDVVKQNEKDEEISRQLSSLCQRRDIIFILINQMNNLDIKEKRLMMKGSGSQKYDSDLVFFYIKDKEGKRTLMCTKNRTGNEDLFNIDLHLDSHGNTTSGIQVSYDGNYRPPAETKGPISISTFETDVNPSMPHEMFG